MRMRGKIPRSSTNSGYDIFVSYYTQSSVQVRKIVDYLLANNVKVWFVEYMIPINSQYIEAVFREKYLDAITKSRICVIDTSYFELVQQNLEATVYSVIVYSKSMKRNIRLAHFTYTSDKGKATRKLYFSTDTQMDALEILYSYKSRFQIEFLYRDSKQHNGLTDSQARSENKLNFQFNAALTAINIAKLEHWLSIPKVIRKTFSMIDIKTMKHNRLLLQRFIDVFGVNAYSAKNRNHVNEFLYYGTIAT